VASIPGLGRRHPKAELHAAIYRACVEAAAIGDPGNRRAQDQPPHRHAGSRMPLTIRFPKIDYSTVRAHWAPNIAFAQHNNATSLIPTPVEPWLINIMQSVLARLPERDAALKVEIADFIGQETQHFKQHRLFNKVLIAQGYPQLAQYESELNADLKRFLKERSLKFQLAYADGFESLGAVQGGIWFEKSDDFIAGADPNAVALWKWHMAEEFEHRHVCFDIYHALFGRGLIDAILNGYFYRVYGFVFAMTHLQGYMGKMRSYMLDVDRARMTPAEAARLDADLKALERFQRKYILPQLLKNFLPWYNPKRKRTPRGLTAYLAQYETTPGERAVAAAQPA
jgi:uncharacterized protein